MVQYLVLIVDRQLAILAPKKHATQVAKKYTGNGKTTGSLTGNSFRETEIIGYQHSADVTGQVPTRKGISQISK